jgi:Fe-S cluster assembly iron-binding protein IscA
MKISGTAEKRLKKLLKKAAGFSVSGFMGTCRGSTPVLKPVEGPADNQETMTAGDITFFVNEEIAAEFRDSVLDYDPSFFGKGLTATWPHRSGCACHS